MSCCPSTAPTRSDSFLAPQQLCLSYCYSCSPSPLFSPFPLMPSSTRRPERPRISARTEVCDAAAEYILSKDGDRGPRRLRRSSPPLVPRSQEERGSTSGSSFDIYSDSDSETGSIFNYSAHSDSKHEVVRRTGSDTELDSEGEEIMKDITELDAEGPAKPRHSNRTVALWKREAEFWEQ